jgi:hypothetical protein
MDNNRDYYQLYLKYKSKYIALKTGGAEKVVRDERDKGGYMHQVTYYKAQTGDVKKDDLMKLSADCKQKKGAECNEDEIIKTYDDSIFNNVEYTKIFNSYPANYETLIDRLIKCAAGYVKIISDEMDKNDECHKTYWATSSIKCDARVRLIANPKRDREPAVDKLHTKLYDLAKAYVESQGFSMDSFHPVYEIIETRKGYLKRPEEALVPYRLPFDPANMGKAELYGNIVKNYEEYKKWKYF